MSAMQTRVAEEPVNDDQPIQARRDPDDVVRLYSRLAWA